MKTSLCISDASHRSWWILLCSFLPCAVLLSNHVADALSSVVTLEPYHDSCFLIRTSDAWKNDEKKNPRYLWGQFELLSGFLDAKPLVVYVATFDMATMLYKSNRAQAMGQFHVKLEGGKRYWFCIVNHQGGHRYVDDDDADEHIDEKARKVGFSVNMVTHQEMHAKNDATDPFKTDEENKKAHEEARIRADNWMGFGRKLQMKLGGMKSHFDYLRVREADHRALTEKTFSDILMWTAAEALTVAFVAVAQVMYFRRFVERARQYTMM